MVSKLLFGAVLVLLLVFATDVEDNVSQDLLQISASKIGYSLESLLALSQDDFDEFQSLLRFCAEEDDCHLLEVALEKYPLEIDENSEVEVAAISDDLDRRGRLLAGLPDKHNWANHETRHCANEGGWCSCTGNVVYTKKCKGTFSCNRANWGEVVSRRWNSNHKSNVQGGIRCSNGNFGGDPFGGHDKQCFCHPKQTVKTRYEYLQMWTKEKCYSVCGRRGAGWWSSDFWKGVLCGFQCTGGCTAQALAFAAGRSHTFPLGSCVEQCYCVGKGWSA